MRPPAFSLSALARSSSASSRVIAALGIVAALCLGIGVIYFPLLAVAAAAAAIFAPIALVDLPLALAGWTTLLFIRLIPGIGLPFSLAGLLIVFAWLGALGGRTAGIRETLARMRGLTVSCVALLVWLTASVAWSINPDVVWGDLLYWALAALLLLIVATTADTAVRVRMLCGAFVVGALLSVVVGLVTGDLTSNASAIDTAAEGRFTAAGNDPNDLAAGLVAAVALAIGVLPGTAPGWKRIGLVLSIPVLVLGIAATQSRGGLVAAGVCILAAFVIARGRRVQVAGAVLAVAVVAAFALAATPGAIERVTSVDNGGNGRSDIWTIAWRMTADQPIRGVGLNQFREESSRYVREPGNLEFVDLVVESPHIVHNLYLQLLVETGAVGLGLFLLVVLLSLSASVRALGLLRQSGRRDLAGLAEGIFVAQIGMLVAAVFLSIGNDFRLWLLLALGPALLGVARSTMTTTPTRPPRRLASLRA